MDGKSRGPSGSSKKDVRYSSASNNPLSVKTSSPSTLTSLDSSIFGHSLVGTAGGYAGLHQMPGFAMLNHASGYMPSSTNSTSFGGLGSLGTNSSQHQAAANAAWWNMASQIAVQDYLTRLSAASGGYAGLHDPSLLAHLELLAVHQAQIAQNKARVSPVSGVQKSTITTSTKSTTHPTPSGTPVSSQLNNSKDDNFKSNKGHLLQKSSSSPRGPRKNMALDMGSLQQSGVFMPNVGSPHISPHLNMLGLMGTTVTPLTHPNHPSHQSLDSKRKNGRPKVKRSVPVNEVLLNNTLRNGSFPQNGDKAKIGKHDSFDHIVRPEPCPTDDAPLNLSMKPQKEDKAESCHPLDMSGSVKASPILAPQPVASPLQTMEPKKDLSELMYGLPPPGAHHLNLYSLASNHEPLRADLEAQMQAQAMHLKLAHKIQEQYDRDQSIVHKLAEVEREKHALLAQQIMHAEVTSIGSRRGRASNLGRPRNLGRGTSRPKKNTVASLLAQTRALGGKGNSMCSGLQSISSDSDHSEKLELLPDKCFSEMTEISDSVKSSVHSLNMSRTNTPSEIPSKLGSDIDSSDILSSDSDICDSDNKAVSSGDEMTNNQNMLHGKRKKSADGKSDTINANKRRRFVCNMKELKIPLENGWKRETYVRTFSPCGARGEVVYYAPCGKKFRQYPEVIRYLEKHQLELSRENFSFSTKVILGDFLIPNEADSYKSYNKLSEDEARGKIQEIKSSKMLKQRSSSMKRSSETFLGAEEMRILQEMRFKQELETLELSRSLAEYQQQQICQQKDVACNDLDKIEHVDTCNTTEEKVNDSVTKQQEAMVQQMNKQRELLFTIELERERRRQHMLLVKCLESRKRMEERERKKEDIRAERLALKEKKMEKRKIEMEIMREMKRATEDMELKDHGVLPKLNRIPGLQLAGRAFADVLMVFEFLHNFGETLGFDMESLPTLKSLQAALLNDEEAEEELISVIMHLLVCAIEDPGIPHPGRHTTILGQSLRQADIIPNNFSEILRIYLYANATGDVKTLMGFNGDYKKDLQLEKTPDFCCKLEQNSTMMMSRWLEDKTFLCLNPTQKAAILSYLCNELLMNKAVVRQIEGSLDTLTTLRKDRWLVDGKMRKLKQYDSQLSKTPIKADNIESPFKSDKREVDADGEEDDDEEEESSDTDNESEVTHGDVADEEEHIDLSKEEIDRKIEKLSAESLNIKKDLWTAAASLRALNLGQDRYRRNYWVLPKAGGVYVEGVESNESHEEIFDAKSSSWVSFPISFNVDEEISEEGPVLDISEDTCKDTGDGEEDSFSGIKTLFDEDKKDEGSTQNSTSSDTSSVSHMKSTVTAITERLCKEDSNSDTEAQQSQQIESPLPSTILNDPIPASITSEDMEVDAITSGQPPFNSCQPDITRCDQSDPPEQSSQIGCYNYPTPSYECDIQDELWFNLVPRMPCDENTLTRELSPSESPCNNSPNRTTITNISSACETPTIVQLDQQIVPFHLRFDSWFCELPEDEKLSVLDKLNLHHLQTNIPEEMKYGWWRITDEATLKLFWSQLHTRGIREKELKKMVEKNEEYCVHSCLLIHSPEILLESEVNKPIINYDVKFLKNFAIAPDDPNYWSRKIAVKVDLSVLEQVETLEEKVCSASMQVKGWKGSTRISCDNLALFRPVCEAPMPDEAHINPIEVAKDKLLVLEAAIERRYFKPPLGGKDLSLNAIGGEAEAEELPKGLVVWRDAVQASKTAAQLSSCVNMMENSIAWDKSIMKASCQFCHNGDNEAMLLLCDGCDKGYHTYCFKPKMTAIPEGDWYCYECLNKATGERNCLVCGKMGKCMVVCDLCPKAFHIDCLQPPLSRVPRGKWFCSFCNTKNNRKRGKKSKSISISSDVSSTEVPPCNVIADFSDDSNSNNCPRKERASKKILKDLAPCRTVLAELDLHDDAWPFLLPVNTKQFPTYRKIIKIPMDLRTIKLKLQDGIYKTRDEFVSDVRLIFENCEIFNEDDSPVGKAGHSMRNYFESRWLELISSVTSSVSSSPGVAPASSVLIPSPTSNHDSCTVTISSSPLSSPLPSDVPVEPQ